MKKKNYLFMTILVSLSVTANLSAQQMTAAAPLAEERAVADQEFRGQQADIKVPGAVYVKERTGSSSPAFVKFDAMHQVPFSSFIPWLKQTLKAGADADFKLISREKDSEGIEFCHYVQTNKGIPVDETIYNVHVKNDMVISFNVIANNKPENKN